MVPGSRPVVSRGQAIASSARRPRTFRRAGVAALLGALSLAVSGCHRGLPSASSKTYSEFVSAFYTGLGALQVGNDALADPELARATQLAPGEPAAWANWGILALRQRNFDPAGDRLQHAQSLAKDSDAIYYLLGLVEDGRGNSAQAIADLRKAVGLNPKNLIATYELAEEIERQGDPDSGAQFQKLIEQIVAAQPDNLAALVELARASARQGDAATLRQTVARIRSHAEGWPAPVMQQLAAVETAAAGADPQAAALKTTFLRNELMQLPRFRQDLAAIKPAPGDEARPFTRFLRLATPSFTPAPADTAMTFDAQALPDADKTQWTWIGAVSLSDKGAPVVVEANATTVRLATGVTMTFPGGTAKTAPSPEGVVPLDFNYDFKMDFVLAGAGGVRFFRQDSPQTFTDVTAQTKLPKAIVDGNYTGAWAVDIEADGDLDVVLGSASGVPVVLRNNGDGTFTPIKPFAGIDGVRGFEWADLHGAGNPDASMIDAAGHLHVFRNERLGHFVEEPVPASVGAVKAITAADVSHDGVLDLLAVRDDGAVLRLALKGDGAGWDVAQLAQVPDAANYLAGEVRLRAEDIDNNGAVDLLLGRVTPLSGQPGALLWLGGADSNFTSAEKIAATPVVFDAADLSSNGRLDLLGISTDGQPIRAINHGTKGYHWQIVRPRAAQATGDQRINSFGVGGAIEIRSGLLVQMQPITGPEMHFGLGTQTGVDVARILWPNGTARAEFAMKADQEVVTEQRLKGSCPFLFAYNGHSMEFVKDAVPWGSAIGLRINNLGTASIAATEEWYKIPRADLAPRDGYYDLRITGELWETYYYDYLGLMVVDHPAGTNIFTDERFAVPAVKPAITTVGPLHKIVRAVDDRGNDVTAVVRDLDNRYLDTFGRGQYQGVTRDHYVEVDLGDDIPKGPLYLVAQGWLHPSDSSINVAISQGSHEQPKPLSLEVPDGHGGWVVAQPNLGFPAGRKKICLFNLTGLFRSGVPHRVRLRTNLEVYWDSIEWAQGLPDTPLKITRLAPASADLHYRGYSVIDQANQSSPEIPDYNHLTGARHPWRDLEGYYTRYGDVRELLAKTDDRYVIMNAGDEMSFRFAVSPPPPAGWVRDFVIAGDGWIKDGDFNTTYSETNLPLPHHSRTVYDTAPLPLRQEWAYRHHPEDWQTYQTRYVTPQPFEDELRGGAGR